MDFDNVTVHLMDSSRLAVVLKAHLWVEQLLNQALQIAALRPELLAIDRIPFAQKLNLALAFGAIPTGRADALRQLNKVRNQAAHRVEWTLEDTEADELTELILRGTDWEPEVSTAQDRLAASLAHLIGNLQGWNQLSEDHKRNKMVRFAHEVLRRYLTREGLDAEDAKRKAETVFPFPPRPSEEDLSRD